MRFMYKNKQKIINFYCFALYALYALFTLTILGYGVYFLEELSFSYIEIGLTIGLSALISSIIQPLIGRLVDIKQYSWKDVLIILSIIMLISSLLIFIAPNSLLILLFGLMIIILGCIYPFLNQGIFYYEHYGIKTNFGVSRGFGSLTYAIFAIIVGFTIINNNIMIINVYSLMTSILMLIIVYLLPFYGNINTKNTNTKKKFKNNVLTKYPSFTLIFISMCLFMIFHSIFMGYMINIFENVGGNVSDISIANSIIGFIEIIPMFLFTKLLKKVSAKKLFIIASIFYVIRSIVILNAQDTMGIYLSIILHIFTYPIIIPATVHFTNEIIPQEDKNEGQAFMGSTITIGIIFANLIGGNILQIYNVNLLLISLVIISILGCIFALSSLLYKD